MEEVKLAFSNRWVFNRVMCHEEVCAQVIRAVLGIEVERIEYLNAEQVVEPGLDQRGIRMDVVAKEGGRVYDIEMQTANRSLLGRRMRYYQAALDTAELERGASFELLPESYIVFLCLFDAYGFGRAAYTIDRLCRQEPAANICDDSHWVVLNAQAWGESSETALGDLLRYTATGEVSGGLSRTIDALVASCNHDRKWVRRVITFEEDAAMQRRWAHEEGFQQGLEQGIEQGEERFGALVVALLASSRASDVERASRDRPYRDQLFRELNL